MPKFEDGEVKNLLGITSGGNVLREHSFYRISLKISACGRLGVEEKVSNPVPEILTKPSFIRHGEADLLAVENFMRDEAAKGFLGDVFGGETANFVILRQRGSEFQDFVIEQRHAELDGIGHGHFVRLDEEIVRKPGLGVGVEHFA